MDLYLQSLYKYEQINYSDVLLLMGFMFNFYNLNLSLSYGVSKVRYGYWCFFILYLIAISMTAERIILMSQDPYRTNLIAFSHVLKVILGIFFLHT